MSRAALASLGMSDADLEKECREYMGLHVDLSGEDTPELQVRRRLLFDQASVHRHHSGPIRVVNAGQPMGPFAVDDPEQHARESRPARIRGGLLGLLIGDCLGVPYEFTPAHEIPPRDAIEMTPPPGFRRAHAGTPEGTWSDDGAQALCLLESLLERGRLDTDDLGRRMLRWLRDGHLAVDGRVFDIGIQTREALMRVERGITPTGGTGERSNGNGSLMRSLPLALWHRGADAELVADAMAQSRVTHAHARSQVCCAVYVMWARRLLDAPSLTTHDAMREALERVRAVLPNEPEVDVVADALETMRPGGTGYVLDTLVSAVHANREPTYERVVRAAIALGEDTDTTACVAGGIAGIVHSVDGIPTRWRGALRGRALVEWMLRRLLT